MAKALRSIAAEIVQGEIHLAVNQGRVSDVRILSKVHVTKDDNLEDMLAELFESGETG